MASTLSLSDLPRALREITGMRAPYQRIYRMVIDGDLPAQKNDAGRWFVNRDDIPVFVQKLGLAKDVD